ncbi:ATP-binding protein [Paenibacillus oryzisoli]|uniref:ATP-binding protein n=1 Tax=Paenibacillus oryzisoli TaxID=1850517 RepID=UPI003D2DF426
MRITLVDDLKRHCGEVECDFDAIMTQAEQLGGDIFASSVSILEEHIGFAITESSKVDVHKYLRQFMAMGESKAQLLIQIKNNDKKTRDKAVLVDITSTSFEEVVTFPNKQYQERFERLVGLDALKKQVQKEAAVLLAPELLQRWSKQHHGVELSALRAFRDRYPFMIFEGDVGTGKTEFAETFGASIADAINKKVTLARMSMKSRGNGVVGEMSKLISKAFQDAKAISDSSKAPVILLLDEADSLAQSREEAQMHHEDRAGVNSLIQGIDHVRDASNPILVVFCTNRSQAIDPAIKRRAAVIHTFTRPNLEQRLHVFQSHFKELNLRPEQHMELAELSGGIEGRSYGFTYSDLITRVIPQAVFTAFPDSKITFEIIKNMVLQLKPTPPFKEG